LYFLAEKSSTFPQRPEWLSVGNRGVGKVGMATAAGQDERTRETVCAAG